MKLIIAGSRTLMLSYQFVLDAAIAMGVFPVKEIVSGGARGVDLAGESLALETHVPVKRFPAEWDKHGKGAGPIRNKQMAEYADALLLIWDGKSRGSANMKSEMQRLKKPIYEVVFNAPSV